MSNKINTKFLKLFFRRKNGDDLRKALVLNILRDCADLIIAVNYLPSGFLWSSKLHQYQVGFFGSLSAAFRIYSFVWNV